MPMNTIKALVAYSFASGDKALITTFTDHFNTLANSYPGFSWESAEEAEASSVSKKGP